MSKTKTTRPAPRPASRSAVQPAPKQGSNVLSISRNATSLPDEDVLQCLRSMGLSEDTVSTLLLVLSGASSAGLGDLVCHLLDNSNELSELAFFAQEQEGSA